MYVQLTLAFNLTSTISFYIRKERQERLKKKQVMKVVNGKKERRKEGKKERRKEGSEEKKDRKRGSAGWKGRK